jgi:hypothetical protein
MGIKVFKVRYKRFEQADLNRKFDENGQGCRPPHNAASKTISKACYNSQDFAEIPYKKRIGKMQDLSALPWAAI